MGLKKKVVRTTQKWIEGMLMVLVGGLPTLDWSSFGDVNAIGGDDYGFAEADELILTPAS